MSERTAHRFLVCLILVFSVYNTWTDTMMVNTGYSAFWLCILYLIGAIIKKCEIGKKLKFWQAILCIIVLTIIPWGWKVSGGTLSIMGFEFQADSLISYLSPTVLGSAILWVLAASKLQFRSWEKKMIRFGAESSFSVYLINTHPMVWIYSMKDCFIFIAGKSTIRMMLYVIGFSVSFVIGAILVDKVRLILVRLLRVRLLANWLECNIRESLF